MVTEQRWRGLHSPTAAVCHRVWLTVIFKLQGLGHTSVAFLDSKLKKKKWHLLCLLLLLERRGERGKRRQDIGLNAKLSNSNFLLQEYTFTALIQVEILIRRIRYVREHSRRLQRTSIFIAEGPQQGNFPHKILHHTEQTQSKATCHFVLGSAMKLYIL